MRDLGGHAGMKRGGELRIVRRAGRTRRRWRGCVEGAPAFVWNVGEQWIDELKSGMESAALR